ncbi:MAG TPA: DUF167 domain-containing protein [Spirochaetia bacterium]|nr:DUF167 domain-containing protein [Spirochaetia bacterium]
MAKIQLTGNMRLTILAKPKKKQEKIVQIAPNIYAVSVKEPPINGRANEAIIKSLSQYFSISRSKITLISGHTSQIKIVEVPDFLGSFEPLPKQKSLF